MWAVMVASLDAGFEVVEEWVGGFAEEEEELRLGITRSGVCAPIIAMWGGCAGVGDLEIGRPTRLADCGDDCCGQCEGLRTYLLLKLR